MDSPFARPIPRSSLADELAQRIGGLIGEGGYAAGARLPSIAAMARQFGVGGATVREALRKLETAGVVDIRHGAGVFVRQMGDAPLISNPAYNTGTVTRKLLCDLLDARIAIEVRSAALAAQHATPDDVGAMRALLAEAEQVLAEPAALARLNMAFHAAVAAASDNGVLRQLLDVLSNLFRHEQRLVYDIHGACAQDHTEHVGILEAIASGDGELASVRMHAHLAGVRDTLRRWSADVPLAHPA